MMGEGIHGRNYSRKLTKKGFGMPISVKPPSEVTIGFTYGSNGECHRVVIVQSTTGGSTYYCTMSGRVWRATSELINVLVIDGSRTCASASNHNF